MYRAKHYACITENQPKLAVFKNADTGCNAARVVGSRRKVPRVPFTSLSIPKPISSRIALVLSQTGHTGQFERWPITAGRLYGDATTKTTDRPSLSRRHSAPGTDRSEPCPGWTGLTAVNLASPTPVAAGPSAGNRVPISVGNRSLVSANQATDFVSGQRTSRCCLMGSPTVPYRWLGATAQTP